MRRAEIEELCDGPFEVEVDTESTQDPLELMMVYLPGKSKTEIFFSTYLCHPSMANNELSGPVLTAHLIKWLEGKPRNYSYRFVFGPETIGPICLLNHRRIRRKLLKHHVHAFNVNCVGAGAEWSFLPARNQDDYTAEIVRYVANQLNIKFKEFAYLTRGSDERQYNSPRVGMQMVSIMRSKYHEYSEYHTHLDNLELVSPKILEESFNFYKTLVEFLEADREVAPKTFGEPNVDQVLQQRSIGGQSHLNNQSRRNLMEISQSGLEYYLLQLLMKADLNFQESIELLKSLTDAKAINVNLISKQKLRGKP
jgi:aminopeptidase-like protein